MRKDLPAELVRFAVNLSDPQHATLAAVLREAADELQKDRTTSGPVCAGPAAYLVIDDDGPLSIGRPCPNCDE
jgi:hypothetical protein